MTDSTPSSSEHGIDELRRLFGTTKGADVRFVCGGMTWDVHSFVLQLGSKVFGKICDRSFKEGLNKRIELEEHEPHLVHRMLQHLYKLDYFAGKIELDGKKENSFVSELHTHVMMYAMGDEYDVMDLKKKSLRKFTEAVKAKKGRKDELASVLKVVPAIYTTTPDSDRGLREFVVGLGAEHLERMKDLPELKDAVTQAPNYMIEILPKYFRRVQDEKDKEKNWCECDKCSNLDLKFDRVLCRECGHQQNLSVVDMVDVP